MNRVILFVMLLLMVPPALADAPAAPGALELDVAREYAQAVNASARRVREGAGRLGVGFRRLREDMSAYGQAVTLEERLSAREALGTSLSEALEGLAVALEALNGEAEAINAMVDHAQPKPVTRNDRKATTAALDRQIAAFASYGDPALPDRLGAWDKQQRALEAQRRQLESVLSASATGRHITVSDLQELLISNVMARASMGKTLGLLETLHGHLQSLGTSPGLVALHQRGELPGASDLPVSDFIQGMQRDIESMSSGDAW